MTSQDDIIDVTQINTSQGMYDSLHIKVYYRNIAGVVSFTQGFKLVQEPFHSVVWKRQMLGKCLYKFLEKPPLSVNQTVSL